MKESKRPDVGTAERWVRANRWLLLRRCSQLTVLGLFLSGPLWGYWILKGNLASSTVFDVIPFADPLVALQTLAAGHLLTAETLLGLAIVTVFYLAVGGRVYCAWVCPVNLVTDGAAWLRHRLSARSPRTLFRSARYGVLAGVFLGSMLSGTIVWEWANPVTLLHRELVFGFGFGWVVILSVFLFDLCLVRRGWCGHLCPVGAFYGILGFTALWRVSARRRDRCSDCMDCYRVCPEPQVITPALKGTDDPIVRSPHCVNCGRCIDVCPEGVFKFTHRFNKETEAPS